MSRIAYILAVVLLMFAGCSCWGQLSYPIRYGDAPTEQGYISESGVTHWIPMGTLILDADVLIEGLAHPSRHDAYEVGP